MKKQNKWFINQRGMLFMLFLVLCLFQSPICSAQPAPTTEPQIPGGLVNPLDTIRRSYRVLKKVDIDTKITVSSFAVEAKTVNTNYSYVPICVGGKFNVGINSNTFKRDVLASGFIRGKGAELKIDQSGAVIANYKYTETNTGITTTIELKGNVDGEVSDVTANFEYNGRKDSKYEIKVVGTPTGKVSATFTYKDPPSIAYGAWNGSITIDSQGGTITGVSAAFNQTFTPQDRSFTFTFQAGGGLSNASGLTFNNDDITIFFNFGFTF